MGIYDRPYYRDETKGSAWFSTSPVTKWLIVVNVVVFLAEQLEMVDRATVEHWFAARSGLVFGRGYVWQLVTATFLHASPGHLLWNMLFLWMVGRELEGMYGHRDFLALYLSAGAFSTFGWALIDHFSKQQGETYMVGASGAVSALAVLYALYYPRRELLFMFVIPVEVWLLVTIYVAMQVFLMLSGGDSKSAVEAHLAGALYGYLFKQFDLRLSRLRLGRGRRPRLRVVSADPSREKSSPRPVASGPTWSPNPASAAKPSTTAVVSDEQLDARLDEVLAKIAREGRAGLTEEENRILQEATRRARNRRSDRL